jgi:hypothetical protein
LLSLFTIRVINLLSLIVLGLVGLTILACLITGRSFGFLECVVICQLVGCLFRTHCSAELGLILEEELGMNDKVGFRACLKEVGSV